MIKVGAQDIADIPGVMKVTVGSDVVWFSSNRVPSAYRRISGIIFDGEVWYETNIKLQGSDTVRFSFKMSITACNVLGSYSSGSADNNYSLYASTSSSAKYMRYNGNTYSSYISINTDYDVEITPTGTNGLRNDSTWTQKNFTTDSNMFIGITSIETTSAKFTGTMYGNIEVVNKACFIPVERISDGAIGYYEAISGVFLENQGTGTPVALGYV